MTAFLLTLFYWTVFLAGSFLFNLTLGGGKYSKFTYPIFILSFSFILNGLFEYFKPFGYVIRLY